MTTRERTRERLGIGDAALKGALSGLIGGAVMAMAMKVERQLLVPKSAERPDIPPVQLIETEAEKHDVELSSGQAATAGLSAHLAYSALLGAVFGLLQSRVRGPALLDGLVFAGLAYAAGYTQGGIMPRTGTLPPMTLQSLEKTAAPLASHAVFGLTTATAFGAMN